MYKKKRIILYSILVLSVGFLSYFAYKYHQYQTFIQKVNAQYSWLNEYIENAPAEIYNIRTVEEIESYLQSRSINVLGAAISTLRYINEPNATHLLKDLWEGRTEKYESDNDIINKFNLPIVRLRIAGVLWDKDSKNKEVYAKYFYNILRNGETLERDLAASLLINFDDTETVNQLEWALLNDKELPSVSAARSLGEIGDPTAIPSLLKVLDMNVSKGLKKEAKKAIDNITSQLEEKTKRKDSKMERLAQEEHKEKVKHG